MTVMTDKEKAEFIHTVLTAETLQIPAAIASKMAECQKWMEQWPTDSTSTRKG